MTIDNRFIASAGRKTASNSLFIASDNPFISSDSRKMASANWKIGAVSRQIASAGWFDAACGEFLASFKNLLQPGLVKELVVADILGHEVHKTKHEPDAFDPANPDRKFEYLSCFDGGTFQLDRMFSSPPDKRATSLERITRNTAIYCAVFDKESPLDVLVIYEVPVEAMLREAGRQLDASRNEISHIGFTIKWAQQNGKVVYTKQT